MVDKSNKMSKISKKQFLKDVMSEINSLKEHGTKKELSRLDFDSFAYHHENKCIYGQMAKGCATGRAKTLMGLSCKRVFDFKKIPTTKSGFSNIREKSFTNSIPFINGEYFGQTWVFGNRNYDYLSALEGYITLKGAKNEQIIQYLKGEIKTLKL